jgi:phosphoenolpyruvate carboxylase
MKRRIPFAMASQHPDHAGKPYWHHTEFISTRKEVTECFLSFSELGIPEYKWDWEGKFVDESVIEKLYGEHFEYFKTHPLGSEKFLTFRLPNPKVEHEFRLGRAFMGILAASHLAKHLKLYEKPLFEVILPMCESAQEMLDIEEAYEEMGLLKHSLYSVSDASLKHLEVIPLFEQVDTIMRSDEIIRTYLCLHKKRFGFTPSYLRPYVARSDPALNSGLVPTVLAIKVALSRYQDLSKKLDIELYPIIGSASLPFRGGLTPYTAKQFASEYSGIKTALIQSAFRYDYPKTDVIQGIADLAEALPKGTPVTVSVNDEKRIKALIPTFEKFYRSTIERLAPLISELATRLPRRRERVQHIGLFGYSRGVGSVTLPRAITFTGALYSLGVPPEIIGTGRGLAWAKKEGFLPIIERYYLNLKDDLRRAGRFVQKETLDQLSQESVVWDDVIEDITAIEEYLGEPLGPKTLEEKEHAELVSFIVTNRENLDSVSDQLAQAALLRKSLG